MPRKLRLPTPRKIQKVEEAPPQANLVLPDLHPSIAGITPTPLNFNSTVKIEQQRPTPTFSPYRTRSRQIMIGVTTYNRSENLIRCLESIRQYTDPYYSNRMEIVIADDHSAPHHRTRLMDYLNLRSASYPISYIYGVGRRGVAANKNRCIHAFLENTRMSELILVDDDVIFQANWWNYLETLAASQLTGHFGSLPWKVDDSNGVFLPNDIRTPIDVDLNFQRTEQTFGHFLWTKRDWLLNVRYMNPEFGTYGYEHCLWSQRLYKANHKPMHEFYVAKDSYRFWAIYDKGSSWKNIEEVNHSIKHNQIVYNKLLMQYTDEDASHQLVENHRIDDFELEYSSALRYNYQHVRRGISLPSPAHKVDLGYQVKQVDDTWKSLKPDEYVTVIVGVRGDERIVTLEHTLENLYRQTVPVRIILVEQDIRPKVRQHFEHIVDTYIFCYSDKPYNRSWAFNVGVKEAQSKYVWLHDGDLICPPNTFILAQQDLLHADAVIPWTEIKYLNKASTEKWPSPNVSYERTFTSHDHVYGGSLIIDRDTYTKLEGMDENFWGWGGEDDIFHDILKKCARVKRISSAVSFTHLWHGSSVTEEYRLKNLEMLNKFRAEQHNIKTTAEFVSKYRKDPWGDPYKIRRTSSTTSVFKDRGERNRRKLHVIYDVEGWAYWHRSVALKKYAPANWSVSYSEACNFDASVDYDVVLCLCYGQIDEIRHKIGNRSTYLVGGFNVGWPRRQEHLDRLLNVCDHVLINNYDCWYRSGMLPNTYNISNGVDQDIFKPVDSRHDRAKRVIWIGSQYHAELKGWPHILQPVANALKSKGFHCDFRVVEPRSEQRLSHKSLMEWYNQNGIYICASTSEGTPNPLLESAACGVVPVSTPVGNVPELVAHQKNGYVVKHRKIEEFIQGVLYVSENFERLQSQMLEDIKDWWWCNRAKKYFDWFDSIVEGRKYGLDAELGGLNEPP